MKKKIKKFASLLLITSMLLAMFCTTAFAQTKTGSGTYNTRNYTVKLELERRYMTSTISYPTKIQLGFLGYAESSLGGGYAKVNCANNGMSTIIAKTVNPPNDSLQFYHGYQEYYIESHYMKTLEITLTKM